MLIVSAAVAASAVVLGLHLARRAAAGTPLPLPYGLAHGALGLASVVLLGVAAFSGGTLKLVNAALLFYCLALVGGLFVLVFRLQGQPPPMFMVYLHAASALLASALLGLAAYAVS